MVRITRDFSLMEVMMTDTVQVEGATPSTILTVSISKGRSGELDFDTAQYAEYIYIQVLKEGTKVLANKGMSKLNKADFKTMGEFQAAVMAKAEENRKAMYEGTMVIRGSKAKGDKVPTEVMTLARNMARAIVKQELKKKGFKISLVKSAKITAAANLLLTQRPEIIKKAAADIAAQEQEAESGPSVIAGIQEDPELKAKAAAAKAAKQLSAAKAGKVAGRGRPGLNA
jgi:hypothetical protein